MKKLAFFWQVGLRNLWQSRSCLCSFIREKMLEESLSYLTRVIKDLLEVLSLFFVLLTFWSFPDAEIPSVTTPFLPWGFNTWSSTGKKFGEIRNTWIIKLKIISASMNDGKLNVLVQIGEELGIQIAFSHLVH